MLTSHGEAIPGKLHGTQVLVVEDHDDTRAMLVECLEGRGARVVAAADAMVARAHLAAHKRIDLIVTDIAMPRESGIRMMIRVRAIERFRDIPAIAISGQIRADELDEFRPGLFQAVLAKPFELNRLLAIAEDLLG